MLGSEYYHADWFLGIGYGRLRKIIEKSLTVQLALPLIKPAACDLSGRNLAMNLLWNLLIVAHAFLSILLSPTKILHYYACEFKITSIW